MKTLAKRCQESFKFGGIFDLLFWKKQLIGHF